MKICRFRDTARRERFGVLTERGILDLTSVDPILFGDLRNLVIASRGRASPLHELVESGLPKAERLEFDRATLLVPVVPTEVWGAGVTYVQSREARKRETRFSQIYQDVYEAKRPELFLKDSGGRRCAGPGEPLAVRSDSDWTVPEPELAIVLDGHGNTIGYTIANDVSARDIEGINPLYLPQAKIYQTSCSIGPVIVTSDEITDPSRLGIRMSVTRGGEIAFHGETSTANIRRPLSEIVEYLKRDNSLGDITVLMTGTGIIPPDEFSLRDGDLVEIEIERIGVLRNPVRKL